MTPIPSSLRARLLSARLMRSAEEVDAFEDALADVAALGDSDVIPDVLALLDDATEYPEVMYGIVHLVEAFPDAEYLPRLAAAAPALVARAPGWAETLHKGILNADEARLAYAEALRHQPDDVRIAVRTFLDDLALRKPQFAAKRDELFGGM